MKYLLLLFITLTLFINVSGQKIEFSTSLNSGLFTFLGGDASKTTLLETSPQNNMNSITNVWGAKSGFSYGVSFDFKKVTKDNYFWGTGLGYEMLQSRLTVDAVLEYTLNSSGSVQSYKSYNATGNNYLNNHFITLNPFIGYRFKYCDLAMGVDLSYYLKASQKGNATTQDGIKYSVFIGNYPRNVDIDVRPRVQLSSKYKRIGVSLGYSYGVTNYYHLTTIAPRLTTRLVRFGISYQLK
jgi:hypothetical protein